LNNKQLLQKYVDTGIKLPEYQVRSLPDGLKNTYIRKRLITIEDSRSELDDYEYELLTQEQKIDYIMKVSGYGYSISYKQFEPLTPDQKLRYAINMIENGYNITNKQFELLTPDQRFQYAMKITENPHYLPIFRYQFELLTPEQQKVYKDNGGQVGMW